MKTRYAIRDCAVCKQPIPDRPFQALNVRACSPKCATELAHLEHPDLSKWDARDRNWQPQ